MKKLIILLIIFTVQLGNAQDDKGISVFHRLLILNSNNELLVVKIENTDFWVTPGINQNSEQTIKQGLNSISETYGIKTESPELKGVFLLKRDINDVMTTSLRNVYTAKLANGKLKKPTGIEEAKWVSVQDALKIITFPHINAMIEKITNNPNQVWGGTLLQFKEKNVWKTKLLEDFYVFSELKTK